MEQAVRINGAWKVKRLTHQVRTGTNTSNAKIVHLKFNHASTWLYIFRMVIFFLPVIMCCARENSAKHSRQKRNGV